MPAYDKIISLGANCELAWNIRNHFQLERAYPFDWWITPYRALIALLENRFEGLFEENNLERVGGADSVRCKRYNVLHHHDFLRDEHHQVRPDLAGQLPGVRAKYAALIERFFTDLSEGKVLFIRNRTGWDPKLAPDSDDVLDESPGRLLALLDRLFPRAEIELLITNIGKTGTLQDGRIRFDEIVNHHDADDYRVSPRGWSELFDRLGIGLRRPGLRSAG